MINVYQHTLNNTHRPGLTRAVLVVRLVTKHGVINNPKDV